MFNITPELFCGACNGLSQALIGHPLDTIKVLQQNNIHWKSLKFIEKHLKKILMYGVVLETRRSQ